MAHRNPRVIPTRDLYNRIKRDYPEGASGCIKAVRLLFIWDGVIPSVEATQ